MRALAIVLVLGCGGSSKPAAAPKPVATCTTAAGGMVAMMQKGRDNVDEEAAAYQTIIEKRCTEDAWSAQAKDCLAGMQTADDAQVCATLLTDEQQANLVRDQDARLKQQAPAADEPPPPEPAAAPPPAPPVEADEGKMGKKDAPKRKKASKPATKAPMPDRRQGDPCDGGE